MTNEFEKKFASSFAPSDESAESPFHSIIDEVASEAGERRRTEKSFFSPESENHSNHENPANNAVDDAASGEEHSLHSRLNSFLPSVMPDELVHNHPWKGILVAFIVGGVLGALIVFFILSARPPETIIQEKIIKKTEIVYRDAPLAALNDTAAENGGQSDESTGRAKKRRNGKKTNRVETSAQKKQRLLAAMSQSSGANQSAASGQGLSQQQVGQTVSKNRSSLQLCYERDLKKGNAPLGRDLKVVFNISVGRSGTVTKVAMRGSGATIPTLKKCLRGAVSRWMFPAGSGSSSVQFPIVFTPSR